MRMRYEFLKNPELFYGNEQVGRTWKGRTGIRDHVREDRKEKQA